MASSAAAGSPPSGGGREAVLTLLSRSYCHLCEQMRTALEPIARRHGAAIVEVDVDAHPDLEAAHGDRVPVLFLGAPAEGRELCHYHLAPEAVEHALATFAR